MPQPLPLTPAEQDLLGAVARFAEQRAVNGVYFNMMVSKSLGTPVLLMVGLGDQALALQRIVMHAAVPDETSIISPNGNEF